MLLSIIIPTKNRYTTLFSVVDMILSFNLNDDIEIVIQDNSDENHEALEFIRKRKNNINLKYYYSSEILSVIENSDKAVLNSSGEYVCFIGDDDGVMPNIVEITKWMKKNDFKALKSYKPSYYWPNQKLNYLSSDTSGNLKFDFFNYSIKKINTKEGLDFTLKKGGTSMKMLPCLYHGIIKKEVLNVIFDKCATYFPGPSPDMANAIALAKCIEEYIYVDFPVVISGKSIKSTGGKGVLHQHVSRIEDVTHLPKDTALNWSKKIPKFWTGQTIWAQSVLKSLENCGDYESENKFNYSYLYASILLFNFKFRKQIFKNFECNIYSFSFIKHFIFLFLNRSLVFIKNRIRNNSSLQKSNIKTIGDCVCVLNEFVNDNKLPFKKRKLTLNDE